MIPFFAFPAEVRKVIYTTNAVESLHMSLRKIIKTRGSFPSEEAAIKLLYLALAGGGKVEHGAAMEADAQLSGHYVRDRIADGGGAEVNQRCSEPTSRMAAHPAKPPVEIPESQNGARAQGSAPPRQSGAPLRPPRRSVRMVSRRAAPAG